MATYWIMRLEYLMDGMKMSFISVEILLTEDILFAPNRLMKIMMQIIAANDMASLEKIRIALNMDIFMLLVKMFAYVSVVIIFCVSGWKHGFECCGA